MTLAVQVASVLEAIILRVTEQFEKKSYHLTRHCK